MHKSLQNWRSLTISKGGCLTLAQSVLNSIPIYYFSIIKAPKSVISSMEKIMRDFIRNGGKYRPVGNLVKWSSAALPHQRGGLGGGSLSLRNKGLLMKWLWRFAVERNCLWRRVIASIYGVEANGWFSTFSGGFSIGRPWVDIQGTRSTFSEHIFYKVSLGESVRFWEDTWIDSFPLSTSFPELYGISNKKGKKIRDCWLSEAGTWDLGMRRNLFEREVDSWAVLTQ